MAQRDNNLHTEGMGGSMSCRRVVTSRNLRALCGIFVHGKGGHAARQKAQRGSKRHSCGRVRLFSATTRGNWKGRGANLCVCCSGDRKW